MFLLWQLAPAPAAAPPGATPGAAVRDTLDAVFRLPAFQRPVQETFWEWARNVVGRLFRWLLGPAVSSPAAFWLVVLAAVGVAVYLGTRAAQRREARARSAVRRGGPAVDPRRAAEDAAAAGDYVAAAHHLYAAVIEALAARALVRPHPAKTPGEYARELRRSGRAAATAYARFARGYEAVVYGPRPPDGATYAALRAAAAPLLDPAVTVRPPARRAA